MFVNQYPIFSPGRVLKQEMLCLLRDYPRDYADILYRDYADGVLAGCNLVVNQATIGIEPGMVRYQGKLYIMKESVQVSYSPNGQDTMLKIHFKKERQSGDFIISSGDILLQPNLKLADNEMELCRFRLKQGARLRDDYQDFADLATEYDTVNILHAPYAAPYESTLSPAITRLFAVEALRNRSMHAFDYAFAAQCAQGQAVARLLITAYTSARLGIVTQDSSHQDLHRHLARILSDIRQGREPVNGSGRGGTRRILVD
jgi:hypothetical protein